MGTAFNAHMPCQADDGCDRQCRRARRQHASLVLPTNASNVTAKTARAGRVRTGAPIRGRQIHLLTLPT